MASRLQTRMTSSDRINEATDIREDEIIETPETETASLSEDIHEENSNNKQENAQRKRRAVQTPAKAQKGASDASSGGNDILSASSRLKRRSTISGAENKDNGTTEDSTQKPSPKPRETDSSTGKKEKDTGGDILNKRGKKRPENIPKAEKKNTSAPEDREQKTEQSNSGPKIIGTPPKKNKPSKVGGGSEMFAMYEDDDEQDDTAEQITDEKLKTGKQNRGKNHEPEEKTEEKTIRDIRNNVSRVSFSEEEENDYARELEELEKRKRREKTGSFFNKVFTLILILACVYVIFLIFGVAVTEYGYNQNGQVEAQVVSLEDIKAKKDYDVIKVQYEKLRMLYELILQKDAILGVGSEDYVTLGSEYASIMDTAEDLGMKTNALVCEGKYEPTKELMYSWIHDYAWTYLTAITQALTANDGSAADAAVVYKNHMYSGFATITNNIISLGEGIKGVDLSDIKEWNPDQYKQDYLNGASTLK